MNLLELQRRMAEDVRRPLTADYEMHRATEDGQSTAEIAASYISPNARLSSFERLEIYNRQYWFRLVSAVIEDFPTLNAVIGTKRFDALILVYLQENPSTSWTLRDLGAKASGVSGGTSRVQRQASPSCGRCRKVGVGLRRGIRQQAACAVHSRGGSGNRPRVGTLPAATSSTA